MQHRSSQNDTPTSPTRAKAAGAPLPAAWSRLIEDADTGTTGSGSRAPTLGFLLELLQDEPALSRIEVAPVLLETIAKGRLGRAVPLDSKQLLNASLPEAGTRLAASVLGLPQTQRKGRSYAHLAGPFGDALLREILTTAPSLLGGVAGLRLALGKPRPLEWDWQLERDGRQRLLPKLPPHQRLIRIGGLWYLDPERAELGPLDGEAGEAALIDAPPLAPEHAEALAARVAASPWAARIPMPQAFDAVQRTDLAPKPVMIFQALTRHARIGAGTPPLAYARLAFDYGGERLPGRGGEALVRRVRNGKLVEIVRKRAEELATMERLESFGLAPAVDSEGLPWDMADALPEDAWVFPGKGYAGALEVNTPARWLGLREKLEQDGFTVEYASSFPFEVLEGPPRWYGVAHVDDGDDQAFELEIGIEVEGKRINLLPAVRRRYPSTAVLTAPENETRDAIWYAPVDDRRRVPVPLSDLARLAGAVGRVSATIRATSCTCRACRRGGWKNSSPRCPGAASWMRPKRPARLHRAAARCRRARSDAVPEELIGRVAALSARRPALVERAGGSRRRWRAGRRHGAGQDRAAAHAHPLAQAELGIDPAGADRGAHQPDSELAGRNRALRAVA